MPVINEVHACVKAGLEQAREAKAVGSSLQCSVVIQTGKNALEICLSKYLDELDDIFVVSSVQLNTELPQNPEWCYTSHFTANGIEGSVHVLPPTQHKCSRCWKYVAENDSDEALCKRCEDVVQESL